MALVLISVNLLLNIFVGTSASQVKSSRHGGGELQDSPNNRVLKKGKGKKSNKLNLSEISQVNDPGFGNFANKYALSMASFKGYVYVGTLNAPNFPDDLIPWFLGEQVATEGAQVWRGLGSEDDEWSKVFDFGDFIADGSESLFSVSTAIDNFGIRKMLVVDEFLYFVTANAVDGVGVWKTDGVNWDPVNEPGFGSSDNVSGRSMVVCGGYLYVGVENRATGAQIFRRRLEPGGQGDLSEDDWESVVDDGFGNSNNLFVSDLAVFEGEMYAGTINAFEGMELWKTATCDEDVPESVVFENEISGGYPSADVSLVTNSGALTIETIDTGKGPRMMFLGTVNLFFGASLFVKTSDRPDWTPVFLFGDGNFSLSYVWSMEYYKGRLYIGTFDRSNLPSLLPQFNGSFEGIEDLLVSEGASNSLLAFLPQLLKDLAVVNTIYSTKEITFTDLLGILAGQTLSGGFTLISIDPKKIPDSLVEETTDGFGGDSAQYGIRTTVSHKGDLILGTAGADSQSGTLIYEAMSSGVFDH